MDRFVIIPGCSDLNRGDQSLAWETKRVAEQAGYIGDYYLTSERNEPVGQSIKAGLKIITPILEHPSRKFRNKENIQYTKSLKMKWGFVAVFDFIGSLFLLWKSTRCVASFFLSEEKKKTLKIIKSAKAIFMKGGGLLQTYGGLSSTYSMYFWVYPILLAHKLNIPVYIMPNSFGPFQGPFVKNIARRALSKCKLVTSRETLSQKMVKEQLGLDIGNYPDLAFQLSKSKLNMESIFEKFNLPNNRKLVAITMRPYRFPGYDNPEVAYEVFKTEMAKFIEWLYKEGYMPVIIEHTLSVNAHENDGACIRDVVRKVKDGCYRFVTDTNYDCHDLKCIYSFCDYIVGTRFHSMIFSFGCGVPGIAIAYTGNKSQGIMYDMGLDKYVLSIDEVSSEKLEKMFNDMVNDTCMIKKCIDKYLVQSELLQKILVNKVREG